MSYQELWQAALGEIELNISKANFITWFRNTEIMKNDGGVITIAVPNGFSKEWLQNKYNKLILRALRNLSPEIKDLYFIIKPAANNSLTAKKTRRSFKKLEAIISDQPFQELEINEDTNLNPKYTFDNFIVGSFNELAQAATKAVINDLSNVYNPLFIYGGVGLGKTHLLQAAGNEITKKYNNKKIKYVSSEKFTSEVVDAIHGGQMKRFKELYRKIDVLIIDDIQFLSGKEKTQEEFFHTFNALHQNNKQIIISSDRPPKAIATLEERLRSRFEGGMIADISLPDYETRLAILRVKTEERKIKLSEEILNYIAANIQKNIRELEGALNRINATINFNGLTPEINQVKETLSQIIAGPKKITTYKNVIQAVAEFYDISPGDLINRNRKKEVVFPRQIAMYLIRNELKNSFPFIGEKIGKRDHTTVMYACEKLSKELKKNESLQQEINIIKERIYNNH